MRIRHLLAEAERLQLTPVERRACEEILSAAATGTLASESSQVIVRYLMERTEDEEI